MTFLEGDEKLMLYSVHSLVCHTLTIHLWLFQLSSDLRVEVQEMSP